MKTTFRDESTTPSTSFVVATPEDLRALFNDLLQRAPALYHLDSENGHTLSFGIGQDIGSASVYATLLSVRRAYYSAVGDGSVKGDHDFFQAGYTHEIKERHCLTYDVLEKIAVHFVQTGEKYPLVDWDKH